MKLWILSDLHLDHGWQWFEPPADADIAVIAGDVVNDEFLVRLARQMRVVFVAGNHEFYKKCLPERLESLRALANETPDLHFLENDAMILDGVRFLGCTLWTDYDRGNPLAMDLAQRSMNDHRLISWEKKSNWLRFRPQEAQKLHISSKNWLKSQFLEPFSGKTVIITHHAPSERSIHPKYAGNALNHAFFSDLEAEIMESQPDLWVHGHVHSNLDYMIGKTRVICNPHGYPKENAGFDPQMVVEI